MRPIWRFLLVSSLAAASPWLLGEGQKSRFFIEGTIGYTFVDPADLNARAEFRENETIWRYKDYYANIHRLSGGTFNCYTTEWPGSGLRPIKKGFPSDFRVGFSLSSRVALFLGVHFLRTSRTSFLQHMYQIEDFRPDAMDPGRYRVEIDFPDFCLAATAWIPQVGVRAEIVRSRIGTLSLSLAGGPMLTSVRITEKRVYKRTDLNGYWTETITLYDMKGKGTGMSLETALRFSRPLFKRIALVLEGGYAWRRCEKLTGPGIYEGQSRDSNAAQDLIRSEWDDNLWQVRSLGSGNQIYEIPGNAFSTGLDGLRRFRLDLSGFRFSAGLTLLL